ncbi:MAG: TonB-dependent receptor [Stagnimonas sp.]|nr:TonB-dependent receptor [Stagnimonas sp.]
MSVLRLAAATLLAILATIATAQNEQPETARPTELDHVTITATRVAQTLEKVPASVTSINEEFLRERAVSGFQEAADYAANVTMNVSGSAGQFVIRGLGTPDTNLGFDPSVGTVVDGVYYGRANFLSAFFNDVHHFEILRGPQGTLFGKNSTAGLFNVVTNKPGPVFAFDGEVLNRGYGDFTVRPALSIPINKDFGIRLSGSFKNGDRNTLYNTELDRPEENEEINSLRLRARYATDNGVALDFTALRSRFTQNNSNFQLTDISAAMETTIRQYDPDYDDHFSNRTVSTDYPSAEQSTISSYAMTLESPLPSFGTINNFKLTAITAYAESKAGQRNIDADFTPIPFISDSLIEPSIYRQVSEEIRFTGNGKDLFGYGHGISFIAGIYLSKASYGASDLFNLESLDGALAYCTASDAGGPGNCNENIPAGAGGLGTTVAMTLRDILPLLDPTGINTQNVQTRLTQNEQTIAGFGQFEYNFLPKWAVIGGLRYGAFRKDGLAEATVSSPIIGFIANAEDHQTPLARKEGDYSPKGGLKFSPSKQVSHYFTYARGYKNGGFNGLPLRSTENEYGPERATSYEFGTKARLYKGRMRVSGSAFFTDFSNLQVSTFLGNRFLVLNAGRAESRGGEVDFQWLPEAVPFLMFRSSVGYTDARYRDYPNGPCYADASNCTQQDLSGKRLPYAPRWTAAVAPNFFFPLGNGLSGALGLDWVFRSSRFLDVDLDPRKKQGATNLYNAFFIISDHSKQWAINLGVRNITNTRYYDQKLSQPLAPGNFASSGINEPRLFTQSISYSF